MDIFSTFFLITLLAALALYKLPNFDIVISIAIAFMGTLLIYPKLLHFHMDLKPIIHKFKNREIIKQQKEALDDLLAIAHKAGDKDLIREHEQLSKDLIKDLESPKKTPSQKKKTAPQDKFLWIVLPGIIYAVYTSDFVIDTKSARNLAYIALFITLYITIKLFIGKERVVPLEINGKKASKLKQAYRSLLLVVLLFCSIFTNIAISVPRLFTDILGTDAKETTLFKKARGGGRSLGCKYRLEPTTTAEFFIAFIVHHCITKNQYETLTDQKFKANMSRRKSVFGYIITDIQLPDKP
ncbi:hypothetical protein A9Q88_01260 [Gammaproteobacteria bacterium 50_400_T64]|nr:hypothetical protein A9Q88_01260 [Gammaproteobacteria bacterium 50_400_T64]